VSWTDDRFGTLSDRAAGVRRPWPFALALSAACGLLVAAARLPGR
jgi:hypothetical protein